MRSVASVALFLIAAFAQPACSVPQALSENDRRELMHLEDVWNQAHLAGDAEELDHLWADDLEVAVPHMAVMTRPAALGFARSNPIRGGLGFLRQDRTAGTQSRNAESELPCDGSGLVGVSKGRVCRSDLCFKG
jgi:hypothetical protein